MFSSCSYLALGSRYTRNGREMLFLWKFHTAHLIVKEFNVNVMDLGFPPTEMNRFLVLCSLYL